MLKRNVSRAIEAIRKTADKLCPATRTNIADSNSTSLKTEDNELLIDGLKGTPPLFFHASQISEMVSPIQLRFLP